MKCDPLEYMINDKMKPIQGIKICPFCGGNVEYAGISSGHIFPGIHTGQMYLCRECGYQGSFIIEVDTPDEVNKIKEALKAKDGNIKTPAFSYPEKWQWIWKIILVLIIALLVFGIIKLL